MRGFLIFSVMFIMFAFQNLYQSFGTLALFVTLWIYLAFSHDSLWCSFYNFSWFNYFSFMHLHFCSMFITIWYSKSYLIAISAAISAEICDVAKKIVKLKRSAAILLRHSFLSAAKELRYSFLSAAKELLHSWESENFRDPKIIVLSRLWCGK